MSFTPDMLVSAVSSSIAALFPDIAIFTERITAKMPERCFVVGIKRLSIRDELGLRKKLNGIFQIIYFSPQAALDQANDSNAVFFKLSELKPLYKGLPIRIGGLERDFQEGGMTVAADFSLMLFEQDDSPVMNTMEAERHNIRANNTL